MLRAIQIGRSPQRQRRSPATSIVMSPVSHRNSEADSGTLTETVRESACETEVLPPALVCGDSDNEDFDASMFFGGVLARTDDGDPASRTKLDTPIALWATLMLYGTNRMEETHFEAFREFIGLVAPDVAQNIPHSKTITQSQRNRTLATRCVTPIYHLVKIRKKSRGSRQSTAGRTICLVSPRCYAEDILLNHCWRQYVNMSRDDSDVGFLPVKKARRFFYGNSHVSVDTVQGNGDVDKIAEIGDGLRLELSARVKCQWNEIQSFRHSEGGKHYVRGEVCALWVVAGSNSDIGNGCSLSQLNDGERRICQFYPKVTNNATLRTSIVGDADDLAYDNEQNSESDESLEDVMERSEIRKAARVRPRSAETTKPDLIRPGDVLCLLRSIVANNKYRVVFVNRFVTDGNERSRFCFFVYNQGDWHPPLNVQCTEAEVNTSGVNEYSRRRLDIVRTELATYSTGKRGDAKFQRQKLRGVLDDGRRFFTLPYVIYWDGFRMFGTKTTSGEGIYVRFLGHSFSDLENIGFICVLGLVPPGGTADDALYVLVNDLIEGGTRGFEVDLGFMGSGSFFLISLGLLATHLR